METINVNLIFALSFVIIKSSTTLSNDNEILTASTETTDKNETGIGEEKGLSLPPWCFDPPGTDCTWYRDCLSKVDGCNGSNDSYAIGFGERICTDFTNSRAEFSPLGQRWVDATRACLQKRLVPALKPLKPMTCKEVQTFAFHTHGQCYTRAAAGVPTFCDLGWADWLRISWIVKQALWREAGETVNQAVHILGQCSTGLFG
ncbi:hypothetical protein MAR_016558 [Mya arenaria]|uniref:Uncharacterized protein n=1 Tax=Mya arenaria TaxID=6604 RepID=A0ABY7FN72_MYAAR|nr:uncharacterized protein LOC128210264 [Mya arenaria]WAR22584.1 hypothetical protein MAR_016558 [Mya arenaria]